jgi:hypothetical protein
MYIRHLLLSSTVVAMLGSMATAVPVPGFLKRATHNGNAASTAKDCSTVVHNTTLTSTPFYITFNGTIAGQPCASINGSISQFTLHSRNSTDMLQAVNLNGTSINGTSCDITIPDSRYQQINGNNVFVFVPLISADGNKTSITCGNSKEAVPLNVNLAAYNIPGINSTTPTTTTTTEDNKPTSTTQHHEQHTTTTTTTTTHEPTHTHHHTTTTTTTTTTHHAAATHDSNGGGGGQTFSGIGTWFIPATEGGSQGACGPFESNKEMIGALVRRIDIELQPTVCFVFHLTNFLVFCRTLPNTVI